MREKYSFTIGSVFFFVDWKWVGRANGLVDGNMLYKQDYQLFPIMDNWYKLMFLKNDFACFNFYFQPNHIFANSWWCNMSLT